MIQIIGFFLIVAVIFYGVFGIDTIKDKLSEFLAGARNKLTASLFPKTQKEILIDNLSESHNLLDRFFSESAPRILGAEDVSKEDKEAIKNAVQAFSKSKEISSGISQLEKQDQGIAKKLINRIFGSDEPATAYPDPTYVPPQCRIEC